ncbi:MAG: DUF402 domain-containing protein [Aigarchaeota archaeon]|nr:DUF402 domain-containing protein [Candidatus Pelearchaeum maunauluense]
MAAKLMARGIYSTALVNLALKDGKFELVQPTESQKRRFNIQAVEDEPDITINDANDRHAVKIAGREDEVREFISLLRAYDDSSAIWWKTTGSTALCVVSFSLDSKVKLDKLRSEVTYTVPWHHYCRSGSEGLSLMVSMAERLVEEGLAGPEQVNQVFQEEINRLTPRVGTRIHITHTKLNGRLISLSPGKVIWRRSGDLKITRTIMSSGLYDGLRVPRTLGDTAVMYIKRGQPYTTTKYYSQDGTLKGEYYNICTPVEVFDSYIRYIDLGVDVVRRPNSEPEIIDAEELEEALARGVISERIYREAMDIAKKLYDSLCGS